MGRENNNTVIVGHRFFGNNISTFYVNGQQLFSKVPESELSKKEKNYLQFAQQNFTDAYFKSSKMKGNKMHSEMKINTTTAKGNSLKLMLDFMEISLLEM